MDVNQKYCQSCHLISWNGFIITKIRSSQMLLMHGQCYHVIRISCGVQRVRSAISRKTPSWATPVINLGQRRNRQDRTQNFRKQ
jgi:hypothetical protein